MASFYLIIFLPVFNYTKISNKSFEGLSLFSGYFFILANKDFLKIKTWDIHEYNR